MILNGQLHIFLVINMLKKIIMSNLIVNIRFWYWHLQICEQFRSCRIVKNSSMSTLKGIPKIQVFKFFNFL